MPDARIVASPMRPTGRPHALLRAPGETPPDRGAPLPKWELRAPGDSPTLPLRLRT